MRSDILETVVNGITYQIENPLIADGLKATVTVLNVDGAVVASDRLNLDRAKARSTFADAAGVNADDLLTVRSAVAEWLVPPPDTASDALPEPTPEAQEAALGLLDSADLLDRRARVVTAMGYAGDTTLVQLVDLVLVSRLLPRPLNLVVTGPSSAGKSFLVNLVVQLFPPHAVYHLSGMSERVLVYTDADLSHRVLIIGEASALHKEGIGASILRAIAWEGKLVYETVEKTADGLRARRIEKEGPTGFVTTTTGTIEPELLTRVLTVHIPDTPETTRVIIRATLDRANGHVPDAPDLDPWHALSWWLETHGSRDVTIPFSAQLAVLLPDKLVRMRRDVTQIATLVQAHALLYQRQRERTEDGRIVADRRDYEAVFHLVADVFGAIAAEGVTPALRETVAALQQLAPNPTDVTTYRALSAELGIDASACRNRCAPAIKHGWIINTEDKKGRPARLQPGDALPEARTALPSPEKLFSTPQRDSVTGSPLSASTGPKSRHNAHCDNSVTGDNSGREPVTCHEPVTMPEMTGFEASISQNDGTCHAVTSEGTESFFTSIERDIRQWLTDSTLANNRRPATRDDGRTMPAAKLEAFVPLWLADLDNGGAPEREARMWLAAVHRAVTASLSEAGAAW